MLENFFDLVWRGQMPKANVNMLEAAEAVHVEVEALTIRTLINPLSFSN